MDESEFTKGIEFSDFAHLNYTPDFKISMIRKDIGKDISYLVRVEADWGKKTGHYGCYESANKEFLKQVKKFTNGFRVYDVVDNKIILTNEKTKFTMAPIYGQ
jgi:hypothetical protein